MEDILEFVKDGWKKGLFTAAEIARRTGRHRQTVHKALSGEVDPPHSVAKQYYEAAREILAEQDQTENRAESEPDQSPSESPVPVGEACA